MKIASTVLLAALAVAGAVLGMLRLQGYGPEPEHGAWLTAVDGVAIYYHRYHLPGHGQRGKFGLEYECVEFVNRWLAARGHPNLSQTGNAESYFRNAKRKGLTPFPNGGRTPPAQGDILVFSSSAQKDGHVGIVVRVEADGIWVAQQNATARALGGLLVKPIPLERFKLFHAEGRWTVAPREPLTCLGWARYAD